MKFGRAGEVEIHEWLSSFPLCFHGLRAAGNGKEVGQAFSPL